MPDRSSVPRGRHAPPLAVRQDRQRRRLDDAAATVFARVGYADATAEAIAREAGMSKATFYEHFDNKESCILALFETATGVLLGALQSAAEREAPRSPEQRYRASISALLEVMAQNPAFTQTLLVEIVAAGPRARERRDAFAAAFATYIDERNAKDAESGRAPRLADPLDAHAIVGATFELAARQLRTGEPADLRDLLPVIERLIAGLLAQGDPQPARA
jgi:AcrR family transcriptional regulator